MIVVILALNVSRKKVQAQNVPETVKEIRAEATRANLDKDGRPLPLAAHWHARNWPLSVQIKQIHKGHHILPFISWPNYRWNKEQTKQNVISPLKEPMTLLSRWNIPFAVVHGTQWQGKLYDHREHWRWLPPEKNPLVVPPEPLDKKFSSDPEEFSKKHDIPLKLLKAAKKREPALKTLSPFGAVKPWHEVGEMFTSSTSFSALQKLYPNPPLVLLIGNNEVSELEIPEAEKSGRYLEKYGKGRSRRFKRKVFGKGWIKRHRAMFEGMRSGMISSSWRENSRIVGYNAFGPDSFGRFIRTLGKRIAWDWHAWDGGIPEAYDNHWEPKKRVNRAWSVKTEMMNLVFMKKKALSVNPNHWFEVIYWEGGQKKRKIYRRDDRISDTPELYRGWVQYVMWLLTPRVAREWEGNTDSRSSYWDRMREIIRAVDLVHADPVLKKFWRKGILVKNTSQKHPFDNIRGETYEKWKKINRWYHLKTNLDPDQPWSLKTELPVLTLARKIGKKPNREWLLYGQANMGDRENVKVNIPNYKQVTVDLSTGGSFYHVKESDGSVTKVGKLSQVETAKKY